MDKNLIITGGNNNQNDTGCWNAYFCVHHAGHYWNWPWLCYL